MTLRQMSEKRAAQLREAGALVWNSTFARLPRRERRQRDTGPSKATRALVAARSGGLCEFPRCAEPADDIHHRLARKAGGRHGDMATLVNSASNLLHVCRAHHEYVTSPLGWVRKTVTEWGWVLREGQLPSAALVLTRHAPRPVVLTGDGRWVAT